MSMSTSMVRSPSDVEGLELYRDFIFVKLRRGSGKGRQGSARDGSQGKGPQSLKPSLGVTVGYLRATVGHPRVTIGHLRALGQLWVTLG